MTFQKRYRWFGFVALAGAAVYILCSCYFHAKIDAASRSLTDAGQVNPTGHPEFLLKLDDPWLFALWIANAASIMSVATGVMFIEHRSRAGFAASPLFSQPALFAYGAAACVNDLLINADVVGADISASGVTDDEGPILLLLVLPLTYLISAVLFGMAFWAKSTSAFVRRSPSSIASLISLILGAFLIVMIGAEMISMTWVTGYTNLILPGAYPGVASILFCTYNCIRITQGLNAQRRTVQ